MPIEIQWNDTDPESGSRRYLMVEKFAGKWWFKTKPQRRSEWVKKENPTLEMWEHVLESLHRRYRRREGVSDEDLKQVTKIVAELRRKREEEQE
jgi:hypothetical protein